MEQLYKCVNCYEDYDEEDYDKEYGLCKHCTFFINKEDYLPHFGTTYADL